MLVVINITQEKMTHLHTLLPIGVSLAVAVQYGVHLPPDVSILLFQ